MTVQFDLKFDELFSRAQKRNELSQLESNLVFLNILFRDNFDFRRFTRSAGIPIEDRVRETIQINGFQTSQTFIELMFVILSEGYFEHISRIASRFTEMVNENTGRYLVVVDTPVEMDSARKQSVGEQLSRIIGRAVVLRNDIDPGLIAGSVVTLPDGTVYDFSAKRQLSEFKSYLMEKV